LSIDFVQPNLWILSGDGITIRYSSLLTPYSRAKPQLIYQDSRNPGNDKVFDANAIRGVDVPELGGIISVTLNLSVDTGSVTLSLLVPSVNILRHGPVSSIAVSTQAILTAHVGPMPLPLGQGQKQRYTSLVLSGVASHVRAK
jgi:hypothetical protein